MAWNGLGRDMLIFIRWLLKVFKKEHALLERYERTHPHFLRYVSIDALLSVVLVLVGFQIYASNSSSSKNLIHSGQTALSGSQLVDHLKNEGVSAYWLGDVGADEYTANHEVAGVVDIFYLPGGADPSDHRDFIYEFKTYKDQGVWDAHTHSIRATVGTQTVILSSSLTIKINPSSMRGVIATFADKPAIVAIAYPKPQTLNNMIKNVESLKLVR